MTPKTTRRTLELLPGNCSVRRVAPLVETHCRALAERYHCPDEFAQFTRAAVLPSELGYFEVGSGNFAFGSSSIGVKGKPTDRLPDALESPMLEDGNLQLAFEPDEVIDNLRLERYEARTGFRETSRAALRNLYYRLRPMTNRAMRKQIQKFHAGRWQDRSFPQWPVDTTVEDIQERMLLLAMEASGADRVPFIWFWPGRAAGCVVMTHDVETEAGMDYCGSLMDLDEAHGIRASFQLVPEERYRVLPALLDTIRKRGFEVGIQDLNHDGRLFDEREQFQRRALAINRYGREYGARGFRAAVLYRNPAWMSELDFSFDMSFPNVAHLDPQRGGCCTVMPFFIGNMLEIPVTTTQDYTLFHLMGERTVDLWKTQTEKILAKHGLVSFLAHPDYVKQGGCGELYRALLKYLQGLRQQNNLWHALPSDVDNWWRARSGMRVVAGESGWRIEGKGAEQAVLAFAKNEHGKLVYELEKQ